MLPPQLYWSDELNNWVLEFAPPMANSTEFQVAEKLPLTGYNEAKAINARKHMEQVLRLLKEGAEVTISQLTHDYDPMVAKVLLPYFNQMTATKLPAAGTTTGTDAIDSKTLRNELLPFPSSDQGYRRVRIIGSTGSGKTTLLRQFLGMHPHTERFPSTASNKTTVADLEFIFADAPEYHCVVTFFDFAHTKSQVEDCIASAIEACIMQLPRKTVAESLETHRDQRFRLFQILGRCSPSITNSSADLKPRTSQPMNMDDILTSVFHIATSKPVAEALSAKPEDATDDDWATLDSAIRNSNQVIALVARTLELIKERVEALPHGSIRSHSNGWPQSWVYKTNDKETFLNTIRLFDSQHHNLFGELITPLVDGIRVQGPFMPRSEWNEMKVAPKLILLDGEGLGHYQGTVFSLPENFTKMVAEVDAVLLVDNAKQPMQAASMNAFSSIVSSGHESKIHIVFTHMDLIEGDGFQDSEAKETHIHATLRQTLNAISAQTGASEQLLARNIPERTFYVAGIDKLLPDGLRRTKSQLQKLLRALAGSPSEEPDEPEEVPHQEIVAPRAITVQSTTLPAIVNDAATDFLKRWDGFLGYAGKTASKQHWARIKALSRHIGVLGRKGYDWLRPAEDLNLTVMQALSRYLYAQQDEPGSDASKQYVDLMLQQLSQEVHTLIEAGLIDKNRDAWKRAFLDFNGPGSTVLRAEAIHILLAGYSSHQEHASQQSPLETDIITGAHRVAT